MKYYESSYDEYLSSYDKYNLHPELDHIKNAFPKNINDFKNEISKYKNFLINMSKDSELNTSSNSDLMNIRDEILGNLNQFTYLLTFK